MSTASITQELAKLAYKKEQAEMDGIFDRMFGTDTGPVKSARVIRKSLEAKLQGVSVSQMIIESR